MADTILGSTQFHISNFGAFGLQGYNREPMILQAELRAYVRVYADRDVTLSITGDPGLSRNGIIGNDFVFVIYTSSAPFNVTIDANGNISTAGARNIRVLRHWRHYHYSPYSYTYYFDNMKLNNPNNEWHNPAFTPPNSDYVNIGKVDNYLSSPNDPNGYVYLAGTSYGYTINRRITMTATKIPIPNLRAILSYFPGTICRNSTEWPAGQTPSNNSGKSCDASGGFFRQLDASGKYIDRKNTKNDALRSTVFLYGTSGFNQISALIGNK